MSNLISNLFSSAFWENLVSTSNIQGTLINLLDILVVWVLVYKLIALVRGTKAIQLMKGIAVILVIRIVSGWIGLNTVSWLMDQVITYGVIAAIIIFQPEVRRMLEKIGRGSFQPSKSVADQEEAIINSYDKAIQYMAKRKIGALVTIERTTGLTDYMESGIPLNADITGELLINIFIPNTPLHDGAVIIRDNKIEVACAYLPLSESQKLSKEYGTRHRAALGISEVSDAITFIVSEETGDVSITLNGKILSHLSQDEYLKILREELAGKGKESQTNLLTQFFSKRVKKSSNSKKEDK